MLAASPELTAIARDSEPVLSGVPALSPAERGWDSERLTGTDVVPQLAERVRAGFASAAAGAAPGATSRSASSTRIRENALRIPFLAATFPQSIFVSVHREPGESLPAMLAAWESGGHVTCPDLPGCRGAMLASAHPGVAQSRRAAAAGARRRAVGDGNADPPRRPGADAAGAVVRGRPRRSPRGPRPRDPAVLRARRGRAARDGLPRPRGG